MALDTVSILDGSTFVVSDRRGDLDATPTDNHGLFLEDTRFLSRWVLTVGGIRPKTLSIDEPNAEPFRIQEYRDAAAQIHSTAAELVVLLQTLDGLAGSPHLAQVSSQFSLLTQHAQTSGKEVVDYAFQRALLLVLLGCGAVLATTLVYRVLNATLSRWLTRG